MSAPLVHALCMSVGFFLASPLSLHKLACAIRDRQLEKWLKWTPSDVARAVFTTQAHCCIGLITIVPLQLPVQQLCPLLPLPRDFIMCCSLLPLTSSFGMGSPVSLVVGTPVCPSPHPCYILHMIHGIHLEFVSPLIHLKKACDSVWLQLG